MRIQIDPGSKGGREGGKMEGRKEGRKVGLRSRYRTQEIQVFKKKIAEEEALSNEITQSTVT
jgi:hypothetical protein